ncbi:DUF1648 domain-containing protein [Candidatus Bathyarchaeota archaeon]|nr:DUF1648 domain-containing protein [Candidatus Bathyarchaeota archaeon]
MRRAIALSILLIIIQFLIGIILYPRMPDRIAIHWNIKGEADGYGSKTLGLFLIPVIEVVLIPFFIVLPRIDPKASKEKMMESYEWFILLFTFYMSYVFGLSTAWNLGYRFDLLRLLIPMLGVLFYGLGCILGEVEINWFLGIRTPWTLSSEEVWRETHCVGGLLFRVSGLLAIAGVFFSGWLSLGLAMVPVLVSGIYVIIYSYLKYKQITMERMN